MNRRKKASNRIKLNNKTRIALLVIGIIMLAVGTAELYKSFSTEIIIEEKEIYKYTNKFTSNYSMNIKSNPYIPEQKMSAGQTYISDLVSTIDMNLNYSYTDSVEEGVPVKYKYSIDVIIKALYESDDKEYEVLNKKENIKKVDTIDATSNKLVINENINVNYAKYHELLKDFKQTLGMNVDAYLYVVLTVDTTADVNSEKIKNQYKSEYNINLGSKIAVATNKGNDTNTNSVKSKLEEKSRIGYDIVRIIGSTVSILIGIYIIYAILYRTKKLNVIGNKFKEEFNRIFKSCQDRVVIVENQVDTDIENTILVSEFEELIKLSEELYKPILCWMKNDEEAQFSVISNHVRYVYILK